MEELSRRLLASLVCGVAGPMTAALAMYLAAPAVVNGVVDGGDTSLGAVVAGAFVGILVLGGIGVFAGMAATLAALVLTGCRRPVLAWLVSVAALPVVFSSTERFDVGLTATFVLAGVVPALARLASGDAVPATSGGGA